MQTVYKIGTGMVTLIFSTISDISSYGDEEFWTSNREHNGTKKSYSAVYSSV